MNRQAYGLGVISVVMMARNLLLLPISDILEEAESKDIDEADEENINLHIMVLKILGEAKAKFEAYAELIDKDTTVQ